MNMVTFSLTCNLYSREDLLDDGDGEPEDGVKLSGVERFLMACLTRTAL